MILHPAREFQNGRFRGLRLGLGPFAPLFGRFAHKLGEAAVKAGNGTKADLLGDRQNGGVRAF
ncbi:hypothetical protein D1872_310080 [compost metagenome]